MCETKYNPDVDTCEQCEQLLHNISTWRDAIQVIAAQIGQTSMAKRIACHRLGIAAAKLNLAHYEILEAFRALEAEKRQNDA